jgi:hypothetical protein
MDFAELLEKARKAAEAVAAGRELVEEVIENVAAASSALTMQEKGQILAMLSAQTAESLALNDRIQRA